MIIVPSGVLDARLNSCREHEGKCSLAKLGDPCFSCADCGVATFSCSDSHEGDDPLPELIQRAVTLKLVKPGSELKILLSKLGIMSGGCNCDRHARMMDEGGPQWCRQNIETIIGWLEEEAKRRRLPFLRSGAKLLVLAAIRRTERSMRKLSKDADC